MNTKELIRSFIMMVVVWFVTPIALCLVTVDIITHWIFDDELDKYQTNLYQAFGNLLGNILGYN